MIVLLLGMLGGGFFMFRDIGDVKVDIAKIKADVASVAEKAGNIERRLSDHASATDRILAVLNSIQNQLPSGPDDTAGLVLPLSTEEQALIRNVMGLSPPKTGGTPLYKLGDIVPRDYVKAIPAALVGQLPRLSGLRYAIDPNDNSLILVAGPSNRVVAIVTATA
jgi:hypothetical protein